MTPRLVCDLWRRRRLYACLSVCLAGYYICQGLAMLLADDHVLVGGVYDAFGHLAPGDTPTSMRLIGGGFVALGVALAAALVGRCRRTILDALWAVSTVVAVTWASVFVVGIPLGWVTRATGPSTYVWLYVGMHVAAILEPPPPPKPPAAR